MGYSFRLAARNLLYFPSHRQGSTYHGFCYSSCGAIAPSADSTIGWPSRHTTRFCSFMCRYLKIKFYQNVKVRNDIGKNNAIGYFYEIRHCKDNQVSERMGMRNMAISHKRTHCQRLNWNAKEQPSERHVHHLHGTTKPTSITTHILGLRKRFDQTVRNRLRETGIFPRRPMRRNVFTPSHLAEVPAEGEMGACQVEDCFVLRRESFSPVTCWWTRSRWRTVLFSDENHFLLSRGDGSSRV